jgi:uncharacterized protein
VVVFRRYLQRLLTLLDIAEAHAGTASAALLQARLAADMLPLQTQVDVVSNFALRGCFPLAGEAMPDDGDFPASFDGLRARLAKSMALLETLPPERFTDGWMRVVHDRAGDAELSLPAVEFLFQYALPNFFFHLGVVYAILRSCGVPLGKADFDGYHRYPSV